MMTKLERLIDLAIAWLEQNLGDAQPAAPKKSRTAKAKSENGAAEAQPEKTAEPEMDEKQSYDELCRVTLAFINKDADAAAAAIRRAHAEKFVTETYKVAALSKVPHGPQRLQLIAWMKEQLVSYKAPAAAPQPAGLGV